MRWWVASIGACLVACGLARAAGPKAATPAAAPAAAPATPAAEAPAPAAEAHLAADPPLLHPGDRAPGFGPLKLHNTAEAGMPTFTLAKYVGDEPETPAKAVLISFFATWCGPCKKELPFLVSLSNKYKDKGLQVVSVSIDREEEQFKQVRELVEKNKINYPVVIDRYNLLARRYLGEKTAMPSLFLVKADGTIAVVKQGYDGDASAFVTAEVEKLVGG